MPRIPLVFVPGFPASELLRRSTGKRVFPPSLTDLLDSDKKKTLVDLLTRPDPAPGILMAGQPIRRMMPIAKQAESLYDILRARYGYTIDGGNNFRAIGWDWRRAIDDSAVQTAISSAITTLSAASGTPVVVIVHSTGGLVFRRTLEAQPQLVSHVEQVLSFGVPWAGNLKAVRYLVEGEKIGPFFASLSKTQTRDVMRAAQAAYDLCPPDPAKTSMVDASGAPLDLVVDRTGAQIGPMVERAWIPAGAVSINAMADSADQRVGARASQILIAGHPTPPITNVVGWGMETEVRCILDENGEVEFNPKVRGKAMGDEKEGDGTVALKSAAWLSGPTVRTYYLPVGVYPTAGIPNPHPRIWDSPPVQQIFDQVLEGRAAEPFICAAADSDEALDRNSDVTIRLVASDANGGPLANARATVRLPGKGVKVSFEGDVRREVILRRGPSMKGNAAPDIYRFTIDVEWTTGKKELPVLIRV